MLKLLLFEEAVFEEVFQLTPAIIMAKMRTVMDRLIIIIFLINTPPVTLKYRICSVDF